VSTVNYLAAGACQYNDLGVTLWPLNQIVADTQLYVRDVVIDYIKAHTPVSPAPEGRIRFVPRQVEVTITDRNESVHYPSPIRYLIEVKNPGPWTLYNVIVTDVLPPGTTFISGHPGATFENGVVTWRLGTVGVGVSRTLRLDIGLRENEGRKVVNTVTVESDNLVVTNSESTTIVGPSVVTP
jgi:uncharacterized repeat protein (TIGR01451 family)